MHKKFIVYGTEIISDIEIGEGLPEEGWYNERVILCSTDNDSSFAPKQCDFWYRTHGRVVNLSFKQFEDQTGGGIWCYEVEGVMKFSWKEGERKILYVQDKKGSNSEQFGFWFIHQLLPLYLAVERCYDFLHGGAVEIGGKGVVFSAPSMGGKSTIVDYFLKKGHGLLADDKVAVFQKEKSIMICSAHPFHRPYRTFETLGKRAPVFVSAPMPLKVIYLLEKNRVAKTGITITEITGFEKFRRMSENYLYDFQVLKELRLQKLSVIMNHVRLFNVSRPWDISTLEDVYKKITVHLCSID